MHYGACHTITALLITSKGTVQFKKFSPSEFQSSEPEFADMQMCEHFNLKRNMQL